MIREHINMYYRLLEMKNKKNDVKWDEDDERKHNNNKKKNKKK